MQLLQVISSSPYFYPRGVLHNFLLLPCNETMLFFSLTFPSESLLASMQEYSTFSAFISYWNVRLDGQSKVCEQRVVEQNYLESFFTCNYLPLVCAENPDAV